MGEVYAARDMELGRDVALKLATGTDADAHARLRREAQHASQLNHPHICTIYEVGSHDGRPFIAMEYVEGRPLSALIPSGGLPVEDLVRYGSQIAEALGYAHGNGVIHRDLKTPNIGVKPDGRTKILDFGLARRLSQQQLSEASARRLPISTEGVIAGTLPCIAPEVLRGVTADERSDIWALGVLLYEAATGRRPFVGATGFELCGAILHDVPPPLPDRIPTPLQSIIERCLAKDPQNRFQKADEVRLALERLSAPGHRAAATRSAACSWHKAREAPTCSASSTSWRKVADISTASLDAYRLFAQGVDAYDHMRMKDAYRLLTEAVRVDPSFAGAYLYLGSVSYFDGRMADRKIYFARAREHSERLSERERLLLQANVAHAAGDGTEAARVLYQLIAQFPDTEEAYSVLLQLYTPVNGLLYDPEKEIATLRRGIEMVPASGMLRNLYGYALLDAGEFDRSLAELAQYARLSPEEPNAYDSLGEANLAAMRPERALEHYARANMIQPDFSASGLAFALAMLGRFDEIVAHPSQDASIQAYTTKAVILSRTGRYREAELVLAMGRKRPEENKHPVGHAAAYFVSSTLATERGQYARARADADTARTILGAVSTQKSRMWLAFADLLSGTALARERN